jgi:hypothetical protein
MQLTDWFNKAMSYCEYVEQMKRNKAEMQAIYEQFSLNKEVLRKLASVRNKRLRVIALTEDWCGDAMVNNPILMKIAQAADMEVRFLLRDQNLELMDQYLTNGKSRSIPIYIFLDRDGSEYAVWGPRAANVQQYVDDMRSLLPDKDAPDFEEKQKAMFRTITKRFLEDRSLWDTIAASIVERIC